MQIDMSAKADATGDLLETEIVERKGVGHPDSVCDSLAEEFSMALTRHYLDRFGSVLHYNVDKALLWGGQSSPAFGGGRITKPMELFLSGRATTSVAGVAVPLAELAEEAATRWFEKHLPLLETKQAFKLHCLVRPGSSDLASLFQRGPHDTGNVLANDTSCGVGFAPLSRLERIVYAVEQELGAKASNGHPEIGRDIKVMGFRRAGRTHLTIACAFVDRFVKSLEYYVASKRYVAELAAQVAAAHGGEASVTVNAADHLESGSIYLTVSGTSAEGGDDGQAGRGNRVNGLITPFRPMTMESVAGKNAVSHVGKLYNIAASLIAERAVAELPDVAEVGCMLVSEIGRPIKEPQLIAIQVRPRSGSLAMAVERELSAIVHEELSRLTTVGRDLAAGTLGIGRWPLRVRQPEATRRP